MPTENKAAYEFLRDKTGSGCDKYLELFGSYEPSGFAVIKIGGESIKKPDSLQEVSSALACISNLGLYPIVVHGAGPQIDEVYERCGIPKPEKINGLRPTTKDGLKAVLEGFGEANTVLCDAIREYGGSSMSMGSRRIFMARRMEIPGADLGYVGEITGVRKEPVENAIDKHSIPLTWTLGYDDDGQVYNVNADYGVAALAGVFKPKKIILITEIGGVFGADEKLISEMTIHDAEALQREGIANGGMGLKTSVAADIKRGNPDIMIEITAPAYILQELFTDTGHGTCIRR